MAKRLNTFISDEAFRLLKIYAATHGLKIGQAVERLVGDPDSFLPASESRPAAPAKRSSSKDETTGQPSREELLDPKKFGESGRCHEGIVADDLQPEIVECEICGQPLPRAALSLHRENCLRAKQGYWDQRAFRS